MPQRRHPLLGRHLFGGFSLLPMVLFLWNQIAAPIHLATHDHTGAEAPVVHAHSAAHAGTRGAIITITSTQPMKLRTLLQRAIPFPGTAAKGRTTARIRRATTIRRTAPFRRATSSTSARRWG